MKKRLYKLLTISSALAASTGVVAFAVSCGSNSGEKVYSSADLIQTGKTIGEWKTDFPDYASKIQNGKLVDNAFNGVNLSTLKAKSDGADFYLPSGIDEIGEAVFRRATFPTSFKLPTTLKVIGRYAFQASTLPEKFVIPKTITSIATKAFADLTLPKRFIFDRYSNLDLIINNQAFSGSTFPIENGKAKANFSLKTYLTIKSAGGLQQDTDIASSQTIPQDWSFPQALDSITNGMFKRAEFPESWKLPESVKTIQTGAFAGALLPRNFTIGNGVLTVKDSAFFMAKAKGSFVITNNGSDRTYSFDDKAFAGLEYLDTTEDPMKINYYTFDILSNRGAKLFYFQDLNWITATGETADEIKGLNPDLTPVQGKLVDSMKHISSIADLIKDTDGRIPEYAFANVDFTQTSSEVTAVLDQLKNPATGIKVIGNRAFAGAKFPSELNLPDSITGIEISAFQEATIGGALSIPNSVTSIGEAAFSGAEIKGATTFNAAVTTLPVSIFEDTNLSAGFTWGAEADKTITKIDSKAFAAINLDYDSTTLKGSLPSDFRLPAATTTLGTNSLSAKFISTLTISKKVALASGVFSGAQFKGATGAPAGLDLSTSGIENLGNEFASNSKFIDEAHLKLPTGLKNVSISAFTGAMIPKDFKLPTTVETIRNSAFEDTYYQWLDSDVEELKINDWTIYAVFKDAATKFDVGLDQLANLKSLGEKAFAWNQSLSLGTFGIPQVDKTGTATSTGSPVKYRPFGTGMVFNVSTYSNLKTIGRNAFLNNDLPTSFSLGEFTSSKTENTDVGLTLYPGAFKGAKIHAAFNLPKETTTISPSLFEDATFDGFYTNDANGKPTVLSTQFKLTGVTQIGSLAFKGVKVPFDFVGLDTVTTIATEAFSGASLPETFRIPNPSTGITIMDNAFTNAVLVGYESLGDINWSSLDQTSRPVGGATIVKPVSQTAGASSNYNNH